MLVIDLKVALFSGLLVLCGLLATGWWLFRRGGGVRLPGRTTRQVWETLPFGIVLGRPDAKPAFINRLARQVLSQLGGPTTVEIEKTLQRFTQPALSEGLQRSGLIHHPLYLRWWHYPLEDDWSLLVLAEGGDQQRLARQQAFVGQLMHELRTPLTALVAHTEVVSNPQFDPTVRQASVLTIQNGAQRMARLVRDMLELYRLETIEELNLEPVNLVLVAEDAIAQLILQAEDCGVFLNFEADSPLPAVLAHPDRIKQVFLNLLDNSIKYCRAGDEIRVRLEKQPEGVLCTVQDSGPGIRAADLPHVTERLYRAPGQAEVEGNGIGLALVNEILRRHHTSLVIESTTEGPPTGTSCRWQLPYI